jgi:hypothetical protein
MDGPPSISGPNASIQPSIEKDHNDQGPNRDDPAAKPEPGTFLL